MPRPNGPQFEGDFTPKRELTTDKDGTIKDDKGQMVNPIKGSKDDIRSAFDPHLRRVGMNWTEFAGELHRVPSLQKMTRNQRLASVDRLRVHHPETFEKMLNDLVSRSDDRRRQGNR